MEVKINIDYNQILSLIYQMPDNDKRKLLLELTSDAPKKNTNKLKELILSAPVWSEDDFHNFEGARELINKSKPA